MLVEKNVPLQAFNTFHIVAKAHKLVRIASENDIHAVLADPEIGSAPRFVLGGGSNIVLTGDVKPVVLKVDGWCKKPPKPSLWKQVLARIGMTLSPGPWPRVIRGWKTWH